MVHVSLKFTHDAKRSALQHAAPLGLLILLIALAAPSQARGRLQGILSFGNETMTFTACGETQAHWLNAGIWQARGWPDVEKIMKAHASCDSNTADCAPQKIGVFGIGKISRNGHYGHLGLFKREVRFTAVHVTTTDLDAACPRTISWKANNNPQPER